MGSTVRWLAVQFVALLADVFFRDGKAERRRIREKYRSNGRHG